MATSIESSVINVSKGEGCCFANLLGELNQRIQSACGLLQNVNGGAATNTATAAAAVAGAAATNGTRNGFVATSNNKNNVYEDQLAYFVNHELLKGIDVAVIGNGPAGILLSLIMSGYLPYYTDKNGPHPTPYLHEKLKNNESLSLLFQDVDFLSEGLEGRSPYPHSLLFDSLFHPQADIDDNPKSRLEWRYEKQHSREHTVIGLGPIGGTWNSMQDSFTTLSNGNWMELPIYSLADWAKDQGLDINVNEPVCRSVIGRYYGDYVKKLNLTSNFQSQVELVNVISVTDNQCLSALLMETSQCLFQQEQQQRSFSINGSVSGNNCHLFQSPQILDRLQRSKITLSACRSMKNPNVSLALLKYISQYQYLLELNLLEKDGTVLQQFLLPCNNVILATGRHSIPKQLVVPGHQLPFVSAGNSFPLHHGDNNRNFTAPLTTTISTSMLPNVPLTSAYRSPVLIIGSGLSAADAILHTLLKEERDVIHVYFKNKSPLLAFRRRDTHPLYSSLYHKMRAGKKIIWPDTRSTYHPLPDARIVQFLPDNKVEIWLSENVLKEKEALLSSPYLVAAPNSLESEDSNQGGVKIVLSVDRAKIHIGSLPNLQFLKKKRKPSLSARNIPIVSYDSMDKSTMSHHSACPCAGANRFNTNGTAHEEYATLPDMMDSSLELVDYPNVYVAGGLAGDDFVRFVLGSAFRAANLLYLRQPSSFSTSSSNRPY